MPQLIILCIVLMMLAALSYSEYRRMRRERDEARKMRWRAEEMLLDVRYQNNELRRAAHRSCSIASNYSIERKPMMVVPSVVDRMDGGVRLITSQN